MKYIKKYEEKKKGQDVVHTLKTKAKSGEYEYDVHILQGEAKYDETNGYSYNGLVISIDTTPGSWYVSTFLHYNPGFVHNKIVIDGGQNWVVDNGLEVENELKEWLENEYPYLSAANKYNL